MVFRHVKLIALLALSSLLLITNCKKPTEPNDATVYLGIVRTDTLGQILEDDPEDWQPRTVSPPFSPRPAFPNPAGVDSVYNFPGHPRPVPSSEPKFLACIIRFAISDTADVVINIFRSPNERVIQLIDTRLELRGLWVFIWRLEDDSGDPLPNGIYRVFINATIADSTYQSFGDVKIQRSK